MILFTGGGGPKAHAHAGEVEGYGLGEGSPDPHPGGKLRGLARERVGGGRSLGPHLGGEGSPGLHLGRSASLNAGIHPPMTTAVGSTHSIGLHSCSSKVRKFRLIKEQVLIFSFF